MKMILAILLMLLFFNLPAFATREYYIKNDTDYDLQFLCFNENECYSINPDIINVKNKQFVGFGNYHYYDISSYKYDVLRKNGSISFREPSVVTNHKSASICGKHHTAHLPLFLIHLQPIC